MKLWNNIIKPPLKKLLGPFDMFAPFMLRHEGALKDDGWFRSYRESSPVDLHGNPIPWVTYPFIDFISGRLDPDSALFEFGSGNSTLFYSRHVRSVTAVEHDSSWYDFMVGRLPVNVVMVYSDLREGGYSRSAETTGKQYDIIIVDGRDRVNCIEHAVTALKNDGVIVLDDSERPEYQQGRIILRGSGFKEIPFWGMAPGLLYKKCTSLFYRDMNCLGL